MPKKKTLTQQDAFVRNLFSGMTQRVAYLDAYPESNKLALATVDMKASRLTNSDKVQSALAVLRQKAEDAAIMGVIERKKVLSEIGRGRIADFLVDPTIDKFRSAAVQEVNITDTAGVKRTRVRLHDAQKAIDLLNKMEGLYTDGPTVNVDNRQVVIKVVYADAREGTLGIDSGPPPALEGPAG